MKLLLVSARSNISRGGVAVWTDAVISKCVNHDIDCSLVNTEAVGKRAEQGNAKRNFFDEFVRTRRIFWDLYQSLNENYDVAHLITSSGNFGLFRDYLVACKIKKRNPTCDPLPL